MLSCSCENAAGKTNIPTSFLGATVDHSFYMRSIENNYKAVSSYNSEELELLWENSFAYRDREAAMEISRILDSSGKPFWAACFYTLSVGSEQSEPSLNALKPGDVPDGSILAFLALFPYDNIRACETKELLPLVELLQSTQYKQTTIRDAFQENWQSVALPASPPGGTPYFMTVHVKQMNAAKLAYQSCFYDKAQELTSMVLQYFYKNNPRGLLVGEWSYLPTLVYLSGDSIYKESPKSVKTKNNLHFEYPENLPIDPGDELLYILSREKDALQMNHGGKSLGKAQTPR